MLLPEIAKLYGVTIDDLYKKDISAYKNYAQRLLAVYESTGNSKDFIRAEEEFVLTFPVAIVIIYPQRKFTADQYAVYKWLGRKFTADQYAVYKWLGRKFVLHRKVEDFLLSFIYERGTHEKKQVFT